MWILSPLRLIQPPTYRDEQLAASLRRYRVAYRVFWSLNGALIVRSQKSRGQDGTTKRQVSGLNRRVRVTEAMGSCNKGARLEEGTVTEDVCVSKLGLPKECEWQTWP